MEFGIIFFCKTVLIDLFQMKEPYNWLKFANVVSANNNKKARSAKWVRFLLTTFSNLAILDKLESMNTSLRLSSALAILILIALNYFDTLITFALFVWSSQQYQICICLFLLTIYIGLS